MTTQAPETVVVKAHRIACDGGGAALGHPRVWLQIPLETGFVECPYCDARYVHADVADKAQAVTPAPAYPLQVGPAPAAPTGAPGTRP